MATSKEFLNYVLEQLSGLDDITYRMMMGEYIIYYQGKIAAYLCDDQCLVKPVSAAMEHMPNAPHQPPYPGAKEMLLVENLDEREFLETLFRAMLPQLPQPKPKKPKKSSK